jgi:hypothetical protein
MIKNFYEKVERRTKEEEPSGLFRLEKKEILLKKTVKKVKATNK